MIDARDHSATADGAITDAESEAIAVVVRRHVDFVYGIARRKVGDDHLAEDVTQAVFILMLRKARHITNEAAMTSWLFQATRFCAANALRVLKRRKLHEKQAAAERLTTMFANSAGDPSSSDSFELFPLLDEAIEHLPRLDRSIVLMHYFQQKSHREVALATGSSEEAVRKRASRAVERMRMFFASRGAVAGVGAVVATLTSSTVQAQAPLAVVESSCNAAILSQWGAGPAFPNQLARSTNMHSLSALKIVVILLMVAGSIGIVMAQVNSSPQMAASKVAPSSPSIVPAKLQSAMPELAVPSIQEGLAFYQDKLGFKIDFKLGETYAALSRDGAHIAIHTATPNFLNGKVDTMVFTDDVDAYYVEVTDNGATAESPKSHEYGLRFFAITDPGGNKLYFGHTIPGKQ